MPHWGNVLKEIQKESDDPSDSASDKVRKRYLMKLHDHVERNLICYYSGFLSKSKIEGVEINDEDKNGLMLCIQGMDKARGLDLFLHTPGGNLAATESLINYLRQMFGTNIRAFVPQIAMSAGTIIACSCREIYLGKHSNLGPIDPQIRGLPAYAVIEELKTAYQEISADNRRALVWNPILSRYTPGFVQQCHWAIQKSKEMAAAFLRENMFAALDPANREKTVVPIVEKLSDLSSNKGHDKHIHYQECQDMGLVVRSLEDPADKLLQDLVLTVHHCYMYSLSNTPAFKIIENHTGRRWVKLQQQQVQFLMQQPQQVPAAPGPAGPVH